MMNSRTAAMDTSFAAGRGPCEVPRNQARSGWKCQAATLVPVAYDPNDLQARKGAPHEIRVDLARRLGVSRRMLVSAERSSAPFTEIARVRIDQPRAEHAGRRRLAGNRAGSARCRRACGAHLERGAQSPRRSEA